MSANRLIPPESLRKGRIDNVVELWVETTATTRSKVVVQLSSNSNRDTSTFAGFPIAPQIIKNTTNLINPTHSRNINPNSSLQIKPPRR